MKGCESRTFTEGLARAAFVYGTLDCDKPFLAPLCTFASPHPAASTKPLPLYVLLTLEYMRGKIRDRRHCPCGRRFIEWSEAWRVDARAEGEKVGIGGWFPVRGPDGRLSTKTVAMVLHQIDSANIRMGVSRREKGVPSHCVIRSSWCPTWTRRVRGSASGSCATPLSSALTPNAHVFLQQGSGVWEKLGASAKRLANGTERKVSSKT